MSLSELMGDQYWCILCSRNLDFHRLAEQVALNERMFSFAREPFGSLQIKDVQPVFEG